MVRHVLRGALALVVSSILSATLSGALAEPRLTAVPEPIEAPALSVPDLAGMLHRIEDYRGRTLVVSFWATWCAPCQVEMPSLARLARQVPADELVVLAVNLGDKRERIDEFLGKVDTEGLQILSDADNALADPWHVVGLPVTYVVAPDGRLSLVALGAREWDEAAMVERLREVADASPADTAHSGGDAAD